MRVLFAYVREEPSQTSSSIHYKSMFCGAMDRKELNGPTTLLCLVLSVIKRTRSPYPYTASLLIVEPVDSMEGGRYRRIGCAEAWGVYPLFPDLPETRIYMLE